MIFFTGLEKFFTMWQSNVGVIFYAMGITTCIIALMIRLIYGRYR